MKIFKHLFLCVTMYASLHFLTGFANPNSPNSVKNEIVSPKMPSSFIRYTVYSEVKVALLNTIVIDIDQNFKIKTLNKIAATSYNSEPATNTLDRILINYWKACYKEYGKLPKHIKVIYATNKQKTVEKHIREAIITAQSELLVYIPNRKRDNL